MKDIPGGWAIKVLIASVVVMSCFWLMFGGLKKIKNTMIDAVGDSANKLNISNTLLQIKDDSMYAMKESTKKLQEKTAKWAASFGKYSDYENASWFSHPIKKLAANFTKSQYTSKLNKYNAAKAIDEVFQQDKLSSPYTYIKYGAIAALVLLLILLLMKWFSRPRIMIGASSPIAQAPTAAPVTVVNTSAPAADPAGYTPDMFANVSESQLRGMCSTYGLDTDQLIGIYGNADAALATLRRYQQKYGDDVGAIQQKIAEDV